LLLVLWESSKKPLKMQEMIKIKIKKLTIALQYVLT
jgi:hypothetical protein